MYFNFPFIVLQGHQSTKFIEMLLFMDGLFFAFCALLFTIGDRTFLEAKSSTLKDGTRLFVKLLSILMVFNLTLL